MEIKFHGHACFELSDGSARVLIDPFLKPNNPAAVHTADEVEPTHVLQTHGHLDHIADTVAICKRTGAPAVAHVELAGWLSGQGVA
jgi:L-ascorbate metabolism protein UlaG (beta-lactamase superfamily)